MKIGLVGEHPSDVTAVTNLLSKKYRQNDYEYIPMLKDMRGSMLDSQKTKRLLRKEYQVEKPDALIFIRDLDGTLNNNTKLTERKAYFRDFNSVVDKKGVFLLNIFEIEALLIADINSFNIYFNSNVEYLEDPMELENPKEFLKLRCKKYDESFNPEIFELLNFDLVLNNCRYFKGFISRFEKKISE
jgi:hypothetical protein